MHRCVLGEVQTEGELRSEGGGGGKKNSQPGKNGLCIYLGRLLISAESHHTRECCVKGKARPCSGVRRCGNTNESCSASPECKPVQEFRV